MKFSSSISPSKFSTSAEQVGSPADDVERLQLVIAEKIEQARGLAAAGSEMHVRDPGGAKTTRRGRRHNAKVPKPRERLQCLHCSPKIAGAESGRQSEFCYVSVTGANDKTLSQSERSETESSRNAADEVGEAGLSKPDEGRATFNGVPRLRSG